MFLYNVVVSWLQTHVTRQNISEDFWGGGGGGRNLFPDEVCFTQEQVQPRQEQEPPEVLCLPTTPS